MQFSSVAIRCVNRIDGEVRKTQNLLYFVLESIEGHPKKNRERKNRFIESTYKTMIIGYRLVQNTETRKADMMSQGCQRKCGSKPWLKGKKIANLIDLFIVESSIAGNKKNKSYLRSTF